MKGDRRKADLLCAREPGPFPDIVIALPHSELCVVLILTVGKLRFRSLCEAQHQVAEHSGSSQHQGPLWLFTHHCITHLSGRMQEEHRERTGFSPRPPWFRGKMEPRTPAYASFPQ